MGNFSFAPSDAHAQRYGAGTNGRPFDNPDLRDQQDAATKTSSRTLTPTREGYETEEKINTSSSSEDGDKEERKRNQSIVKLARTHSQASNLASGHPYQYEEGSVLDVKCPNFKPKAWAKAMLNLQSQDPEHYQNRTAGFAFKDLNVWGYGSDTDYQKTVGNIFLEAVGLAKRLFGNKGRQIDILQHLDGVVEEGEMLVVLGPPGRSEYCLPIRSHNC